MYEDQTFEAILNRMLDRVPNNVDKRPGSIIYDALAPAAAELAQMYIDLDININLSYADTSTGEYLERRAAEFGINREPATKARRKGLFYASGDAPMDVPVGSRFSLGDLNYVAVSKISLGVWNLECETEGVVGNQDFGQLLPIDYIEGLTRAELADVLVPGEDAETDESLRKRYIDAVNEQPFGGNIADYKTKIDAINGVGGTKVFPTWQGGGTVKCTIIGSDFNPPSPTLVDEVQTTIDPLVNSGQGIGLAPIGHEVTITGAQNVDINVETTLTLDNGVTIGQVQGDIEDAISDYLLSLRKSWADESSIIVRISQVESRILTVQGVLDVTGTTLNGNAENVMLSDEEIPALGTVTLNE